MAVANYHGTYGCFPPAYIPDARGRPMHSWRVLILPFLERLGHVDRPWDFRVPGVTSISADLHKYGYAPKGISTVTYRDRALRRYQMFVFDGWLGGLYGSPSMAGTRGTWNAPVATTTRRAYTTPWVVCAARPPS